MRFDGKMSAKRRQEAIADFSVPLEEEDSSFSPHIPTVDKNIDDDDFIVDDDDDDYENNQPLSVRKRAKSKANSQSRKGNPRVMLLSLKAVREAIQNKASSNTT